MRVGSAAVMSQAKARCDWQIEYDTIAGSARCGKRAAPNSPWCREHTRLTPPFGLSPRKLHVVFLLLKGCGNKEIARIMGLKEQTVKAYLNSLFTRFGIRDGVKRVRLAMLLSTARKF